MSRTHAFQVRIRETRVHAIYVTARNSAQAKDQARAVYLQHGFKSGAQVELLDQGSYEIIDVRVRTTHESDLDA